VYFIDFLFGQLAKASWLSHTDRRVAEFKLQTLNQVMLKAESMADVDAFPAGKWNIPEPPRDGPSRVEALDETSGLDLFVVPGLAFDRKNGRLGQGAGFYDRYLAKAMELKQGPDGGKLPLVGVTLDELMIDEVPRDDNDIAMKEVLWPSKS